MPRFAAYALVNSRQTYRQFFTLGDARVYADTLTEGIVWDRLRDKRV